MGRRVRLHFDETGRGDDRLPCVVATIVGQKSRVRWCLRFIGELIEMGRDCGSRSAMHGMK